MQIRLGEQIKELRGRDGRTQDDLACALGVTAQAVSRWEKGICYPDMELLPAIADYFSVTTDELLGVRKAERELRLAEIKREIRRLNEVGSDAECLAYARQAVAEFPSEESLQLNLADSLQSSIWAENPDKAQIDEAEKILKTILENTRDIDIKCKAINGLVTHYSYWLKDDDRALETANRLPALKYSRELTTAWHIRNNTGSYIQRVIELCTEHLTVAIKELVLDVELPNDESTWERKVHMLKTANEITKMIFGEDMMQHHSESSYYAWYMATYQIALGKLDDALDSLEEMAEHAIEYDRSYENDRGRHFTSPFVSALAYPEKGGEYHELEEHNLCWEGLRHLKNSRCDCLRDNERFKDIFKKLESRAK